jgi:hypothetical protein
MKASKSVMVASSLLLLLSSTAIGGDKKLQRGMLESMQAIPCGAKQKGVNGLGSLWASVGVESVNSHEQLCPQYLLRTDQMDYHIRPMDLKHAVVLPVGQEAQFKIKKDRMLLRIADGDKKERAYQVVSMQPPNSDSKVEGSAYRPTDDKQANSRPMTATGNPNPNQVTDRPPQP